MIARPHVGWIPAAEAVLLPDDVCSSQEDKALEKISTMLRYVKMYDMPELQELGDEMDLGLDFAHLARHRIVEKIHKKSQDYQLKAIQKAVKAVHPEQLQACLEALDR